MFTQFEKYYNYLMYYIFKKKKIVYKNIYIYILKVYLNKFKKSKII